MKPVNRIQTLDAFRFIAITMVVFFHYCTRWTQPMANVNYYPYGQLFNHIPVIDRGGLGVCFFFVISGFVIIFTLERTNKIQAFFTHRLIRLWPTMLLCSIITFVILRYMDPLHSFKLFEVSFRNFLPSLSFTSPSFWNVQFMDSAYWSLEVEVKFYMLSAMVYFLAKAHFIPLWTMVGLLVSFMFYFIPYFNNSNIFRFLLFPQYLPFFSAGILFYQLFKKTKAIWIWPALAFTFFLCLEFRTSYIDKAIIAFFYILFGIFIYGDKYLQWLNHPLILTMGLSSYPLYLLHQHAGVLLINKIEGFLPLTGTLQLLYPIIIYFIMSVTSYLIYKYYELPIKFRLRRIKLLFPDRK